MTYFTNKEQILEKYQDFKLTVQTESTTAEEDKAEEKQQTTADCVNVNRLIDITTNLSGHEWIWLELQLCILMNEHVA